MRELQQRQKVKRWLYSIPALLLLLVLTGAMARGAYDLLIKERQSAKDAQALKEQVSNLTLREATLREEIDRLGTVAGVEEAIKAKYNVAGAGEHVAIIVDKTSGTTTTPEVLPWYKRLWNVIIGQ